MLRKLPYNAQLVHGPDLGGEASGPYLPAVRRYGGRFYQELNPREEGALHNSPHHWIIVSALYGPLTPEELIQQYSCHTLDDAGITGIWTDSGLLTSLLLAYAQKFEVGVVVNLLADASYTGLFNWDRITRRVPVLWAFGEQNTGPSLLPAFGWLAREKLLEAPAEELLNISEAKTYITDYEDVVLTPKRYPPSGFLGNSKSPEE